MTKEVRAVEYTFFRFPSNYAIMIFPTLFGIISYFLNPQKIETEGTDHINQIQEMQKTAIIDYFDIIKLSLVILVSFFITYRWASIHKDGSYGYFLTQGINRKRFYLISVGYFLGLSFVFTWLGFLIILNFGGLSFSWTSVIFYTFTLFAIVLLILSFSILLAQVIKIPELAATGVSIIVIANSNFNSNVDSFIAKMLNPELNILAGNSILPLITSILVSMIMMLLGYLAHVKIDVEL